MGKCLIFVNQIKQLETGDVTEFWKRVEQGEKEKGSRRRNLWPAEAPIYCAGPESARKVTPLPHNVCCTPWCTTSDSVYHTRTQVCTTSASLAPVHDDDVRWRRLVFPGGFPGPRRTLFTGTICEPRSVCRSTICRSTMGCQSSPFRTWTAGQGCEEPRFAEQQAC